MPGMNRTGPMGGGPMTGGGWGSCNPANVGADRPVVAEWGRRGRSGGPYGGSFSRRRSRCRTWRQASAFRTSRSTEPATDIDKLQAEIDFLANMLDRLSKRIEALRGAKFDQPQGNGSG